MEEDDKIVQETPADIQPELEPPVHRWEHLAPRADSWRRQYYLKERNITVGQLVSTIRANNYSLETASENLELPVDVLKEALRYYEQNKELIQQEAAAERQALAAKGFKLEPPPLS
jgi:predicted ribosome quality control (RQC) complex YloA/Tae2 family protein